MTISFVGGGVMAEALIKGIIKAGIATPSEIIVSEPVSARRIYLEAEFGIKTVEMNIALVGGDELLVLAVKPQTLPQIFSDFKDKIKEQRSVVSIVAGATMETIRNGLSHESLIRVMPNTPAQIGMGMSVWTASNRVPDADRSTISQILRTLGEEYYVENEGYIDMATGLSASGPAYVFLFIESLIDAGVYLGMPRDMARKLSLQTILGSAELVRQTGDHPAVLKDMVTSPGGTTIEGLTSMEKSGFRSAVTNGVRAAFNRSKELG